MVKTNKTRVQCKKGREWIQKKLESEGLQGDDGARQRWVEEWFKRKFRYYDKFKKAKKNKKAGIV